MSSSPKTSAAAIISNRGSVDAASFRIKFTIVSLPINTETGYEDITLLITGGQAFLTHTFFYLPDSPYTVTVTVDYGNAISESNENNNQTGQTFN